MEHKIKVLILEHDQHDIELLQYELRKSKLNYTVALVQTREAFENELLTNPPDIILSDYSLPSFDGLSAYRIKQNITPDVPFIIVSGTIGEERAVDLIKMGVTDYGLKEKMYQIMPKIERALQESAGRKKKNEAEQQLWQREAQLQRIMDLSLDVICTIDREGRFVNVGAASTSVMGYKPDELFGSRIIDLVHEEDREKTDNALAALKNGIDLINLENRIIRKAGAPVTLYWSARWHIEEQLGYFVARDATEIKKAEAKIRYNEKRFRTLLQNSNDGLTLMKSDGSVIERSPSALRILGLNEEEFPQKLRIDLVHPDDVHILNDACQRVKQNPHEIVTIEYRLRMPDGSYKWLETNLHNQLEEPAVEAIVINFRDITEKKTAELALEESERKYRNLFNFSPIPMWVFDTLTLDFLDVNEAAIRHYGYSRNEFLSMTLYDIRPQEEIEKLNKVFEAFKEFKLPYQAIARHLTKGGRIIDVEIKNSLVNLNRERARLELATDITERIKYLKDVEAQNEKLREIAWIQSHVVRAPLARLMGLINLLECTPETVNTDEILRLISSSAVEMDVIIRDIVRKTEQVNDHPIVENKFQQ